jgi:hypothetical protein
MNLEPPKIISTGDVSLALGVGVTKQFLIETLGIKPVMETKVAAYWDDIDFIRERLAYHFLKQAGIE